MYTNPPSKTLLVTLADSNYIQHAKQLFSSVYWNAGWKGDYMLLAHEVPEAELVWFRERGILVRECTPIVRPTLAGVYPLSVLNKFYLFTPEFQKWENVLFIDPDIIVRYSLDDVAHVRGFHAHRDSTFLGVLQNQFAPGSFKNLDFNPNAPALNTGVMAFSTDIIVESTFDAMLNMATRYENISLYAEQSILSLYFYGTWRHLSFLYNIFMPALIDRYHIAPAHIDGPILHFCGKDKPWNPGNFFYEEWKTNLDNAERIDLQNRSLAVPRMLSVPRKLWLTSYFTAMKEFFDAYYFVDRQIGRFGKFLRNYKN